MKMNELRQCALSRGCFAKAKNMHGGFVLRRSRAEPGASLESEK
jgi:hypothetical protein